VLTVSPGNSPAINLYESAGFVNERFIPAFYGEGEDRFILRWQFSREGLQGSV
jgi:ribosomal protein S18 acetylase RimI-like enzyme